MIDKSDNIETIQNLLRLLDGGVREPEVMRDIHEILRDDPEATRFYLRQMHLRASIRWYLANDDSTLPGEPDPVKTLPAEPARIVFHRKVMLASMMLALVVLGSIGFWGIPRLYQRFQRVGHIARTVDVTWQQESRQWKSRMPLYPQDEIRIQEGLVEVLTAKGASVILEGPAVFRIQSAEDLVLQSGQLFAHVPPQAIGLTVHTPSSQILDLGTEFGVAVEQQGNTDVHVIQGRLEVGTQSQAGRPAITRALAVGDAVRIRQDSSRVEEIACQPEQFTQDLNYQRVIQKSKPFVYFSFEGSEEAKTVNRAGNHHHLQLVGDVRVVGSGPRQYLQFDDPQQNSYTTFSEPVEHLLENDFTFEMWVRPASVRYSALLIVKHLNEDDEIKYEGADVGLLELLDYRIKRKAGQRSLRWMLRFPPSMEIQDGGNVWGTQRYQPGEWCHVACVRKGDFLLAYLDGKLQGKVRYSATTKDKMEILIGRNYSLDDPRGRPGQHRNFIGAIDEFLFYQRALTDAEIRSHFILFQAEQ